MSGDYVSSQAAVTDYEYGESSQARILEDYSNYEDETPPPPFVRFEGKTDLHEGFGIDDLFYQQEVESDRTKENDRIGHVEDSFQFDDIFKLQEEPAIRFGFK